MTNSKFAFNLLYTSIQGLPGGTETRNQARNIIMDEYEQENDKKMIFSLIDNPISQILSFHIIINCSHICINYVCTYEHTFLLYTYVKHFFLLFLLLPTLIFSDRK